MKHWKYLKYVIRHKWFVFLACWRRGIIWRGITHDLSKLRPSEWFAYAQYFYGDNVTEWDGHNFDDAWLCHQHRNSHHWQHYVLREDSGATKILPMHLTDIREMVCDWEGAGRAITGSKDPAPWYMKNREKILLASQTRRWVEMLLQIPMEQRMCLED